MARIALFALLVLAAGSAEAVKLRLDPYSTQCINEEAVEEIKTGLPFQRLVF